MGVLFMGCPHPPLTPNVGELRILSQLSGGDQQRPYGHRPRSGVGEGFAVLRTGGLNSLALPLTPPAKEFLYEIQAIRPNRLP